MNQDRFGADRLVVAGLTGPVQRHADWHELSEPETAAAVAELQEILAGRDDGPALLAEVAGLLIGLHEGQLEEPKATAAAQLCRLAGAGASPGDPATEPSTAPGSFTPRLDRT